MTPRHYATPAAFKQALEQRLRAATGSGVELARRRQLLVFDRFLARVADELGDSVTLKGGLAMELRLERARTTRDVDVRVVGSPDGILDVLRSAARRDLDDFMVFAVSPDERHPEIRGDGMKYEGMRFKATSSARGARIEHSSKPGVPPTLGGTGGVARCCTGPLSADRPPSQFGVRVGRTRRPRRSNRGGLTFGLATGPGGPWAPSPSRWPPAPRAASPKRWSSRVARKPAAETTK